MRIIRLFLPVLLVSAHILVHAQTWENVECAWFSQGEVYSPSLAIDQNSGTPYVSYSDRANGDRLTVKKFDGSYWVSVGSPGFAGSNVFTTSIALDRSGNPYVVYENLSNVANITKFDGTNWVALGSQLSNIYVSPWGPLAVDASGIPYLVFRVNYLSANPWVFVMKYNGTKWVDVGNTPLSAGPADYTTIALDSGGTPYVAYLDHANSNKATVMKYNGTVWVPVGNSGFSAGEVAFLKLVIAPGGIPYVAFQDYGTGKATVMKYNGSAWELVGSSGFSSGRINNISMAISDKGIPFVVYIDGAHADNLTVMKYFSGNWVQVGNAGFSSGGSIFPTIAVGPGGTPYVCYERHDNHRATVMKATGESTGITTMDNSSANSMTISPNPNNGLFSLTLSSPVTENVTIIVTNMLGEKVKEIAANTNREIEISLQIPNGIYIISAVSETGCISSKMVISE